MDRNELIEEILEGLDGADVTSKVLVGVDGYIDRIQHPVQAHQASGNSHFPTLAEFGEHVVRAADKSAQVELDTSVVKPGGNAPIMSHALGCLGVKNTCLGTLGERQPEGVFHSMHENCQLLTLGKPAESNALEFNDGKLILSDLSAFADMDWDLIKSRVGLTHLRDLIRECGLIALVGWCNPPHATNIWRGMLEEVIDSLETPIPTLFFDLADPSKKSDDQILEVIDLINAFANETEVILGLNENETIKLYRALKRASNSPTDLHELKDIADYIYDEMNIHSLVVHPIDRCLVTNGNGTSELHGKRVASPKVSTGGGDNFNAGFCFGLLAGFPLMACMMMAMATSGAYVQNGESPNIGQIKKFLTEMKD